MGCPGGRRTIRYTCISIYARFAGQFFFQVFLVNDCYGKKGHCSVFGCNNDCLFVQKALVNTEQVHPGHPIILLRFNKFNMAAVSVNRSIAYQQVVKI